MNPSPRLYCFRCPPRCRCRRARRDPIRFVTDWKAQAEHGGFYQALAKGFMPSAAWT